MDYSDDSRFAKSSAKLLEAVGTLIGPGSGVERCVCVCMCVQSELQ